MKKVSVVIPAYNAGKWIGETLKSVMMQDYDDPEVIVVDDGSTDNTAGIVRTYPSVRYQYKVNGGTATARNLGIHMAQGQYIAFLDGDDLWFPDKLSLQMALIERDHMQWVYSDAYAFDSWSGEKLFSFKNNIGLYSGDVLAQLFMDCFIASPTPVINRKIFDEIGYFNESPNTIYCEDWEMWLRIARYYPIQFVDRPLALYRVHTASKTGGKSRIEILDAQLKIIEMLSSLDPSRLGPIRNKSMAHAFKRAGCGVLAAGGKRATARELFRSAVSLDPFLREVYLYYAISFLSNKVFKRLYDARISLRAWRCTDNTTAIEKTGTATSPTRLMDDESRFS